MRVGEAGAEGEDQIVDVEDEEEEEEAAGEEGAGDEPDKQFSLALLVCYLYICLH